MIPLQPLSLKFPTIPRTVRGLTVPEAAEDSDTYLSISNVPIGDATA